MRREECGCITGVAERRFGWKRYPCIGIRSWVWIWFFLKCRGDVARVEDALSIAFPHHKQKWSAAVLYHCL